MLSTQAFLSSSELRVGGAGVVTGVQPVVLTQAAAEGMHLRIEASAPPPSSSDVVGRPALTCAALVLQLRLDSVPHWFTAAAAAAVTVTASLNCD